MSTGIALVVLSAVLVRWAGTRPGYDPYGWLVWGHQTLQWNLDTNGAPSWKPLPYLFTVPYALAGGYELWLWLVTSVAIGLSGAVFAGRIAYRLTPASGERRYPAIAAGVFAGLGMLGITGYMHYILSAQSDPVITSLCLGAIDCHLCGRRRTAFVLGVLASLGRPEVWPFLGLYALWAARSIPPMRVLVAAGLALIPLLWFGIPALTSASPFVAGNLALHSPRALHTNQVLGVIDRFLGLHEWPLQLAALAATVLAVIRRDRTTLVLAAGIIAWVGVEIAFALHGWPGLDRYMFEAAGVTVVLAGVAVGQVLATAPGLAGARKWGRTPSWAGIAVVVLLVGSLVPAAVSRLRTERKDIYREQQRTRQINRLQALITKLGGPARINACGGAVSNVEFQSITAWEMGTNVGVIGYHPEREVRLRRSRVLFREHGFGWTARAYHAHGSCRRLRAHTSYR